MSDVFGLKLHFWRLTSQITSLSLTHIEDIRNKQNLKTKQFLSRSNSWYSGEDIRGLHHNCHGIPVDDHWYGCQCLCHNPLPTILHLRHHCRQVTQTKYGGNYMGHVWISIRDPHGYCSRAPRGTHMGKPMRAAYEFDVSIRLPAPFYFLAFTRWAYRIPIKPTSVSASVSPHIQIWKPPQPVSRSQLNFYLKHDWGKGKGRWSDQKSGFKSNR